MPRLASRASTQARRARESTHPGNTRTMTYSRAITELVQKESEFVDRLVAEVGKVIVGQQQMVERLLIGLLANGHVLLEGVPGLAKTLTVRCLCDAVHAQFSRIQFTPDLLPAD